MADANFQKYLKELNAKQQTKALQKRLKNISQVYRLNLAYEYLRSPLKYSRKPLAFVFIFDSRIGLISDERELTISIHRQPYYIFMGSHYIPLCNM